MGSALPLPRSKLQPPPCHFDIYGWTWSLRPGPQAGQGEKGEDHSGPLDPLMSLSTCRPWLLPVSQLSRDTRASGKCQDSLGPTSFLCVAPSLGKSQRDQTFGEGGGRRACGGQGAGIPALQLSLKTLQFQDQQETTVLGEGHLQLP